MGGQEGDIGTIKTADGEFVVENTIHLAGTKIGHVGYVSHGMIKVGDTVSMEVDRENRTSVSKKPQCNTSSSGSTPPGTWNTC